MSVLDDILDGVRADLAARQQEHFKLERLKETVAAGSLTQRRDGCTAGTEVAGHRGSEAVQPVQGCARSHRRPSRPRRRLRGRRGPDHQRADGEAPVRRKSRGLRRSPGGGGGPGAGKDFIGSSYQLWEARAHGADLCTSSSLRSSRTRSSPWSSVLFPLGSCHSSKAHDGGAGARLSTCAGATVLGVNARNLATLEVNRGVFYELAPRVPAGIIKIAERACAGRTTCWPTPPLARTPCSWARAWSRACDPRSAVADLPPPGRTWRFDPAAATAPPAEARPAAAMTGGGTTGGAGDWRGHGWRRTAGEGTTDGGLQQRLANAEPRQCGDVACRRRSGRPGSLR